MWTDHETDILREFRSRPEHFPLSRRIVRIGANKKTVVAEWPALVFNMS
jgi:hypothetical protein